MSSGHEVGWMSQACRSATSDEWTSTAGLSVTLCSVNRKWSVEWVSFVTSCYSVISCDKWWMDGSKGFVGQLRDELTGWMSQACPSGTSDEWTSSAGLPWSTKCSLDVQWTWRGRLNEPSCHHVTSCQVRFIWLVDQERLVGIKQNDARVPWSLASGNRHPSCSSGARRVTFLCVRTSRPQSTRWVVCGLWAGR